jgi:hypothetical protein
MMMMSTSFFLSGRTAVLLPVALLVGCGGDLTLPNPTGAGVTLQVVGGNDQTGTVGEALPKPLVVKVVTESGTPIADRQVAFVADPDPSAGRLDPDTARSNSKGEAVAEWILGTTPGSFQAEARLVVPDSEVPKIAHFEASAIPGAPDTLSALSPTTQPGRRDKALDPLVVKVVDRFGNAIGGTTVAWEVKSGGGELSASETQTETDGTTSVTWTLGDQSGFQRATATVSGATGSPLTFEAFVLF